jgi:hypothetical protein
MRSNACLVCPRPGRPRAPRCVIIATGRMPPRRRPLIISDRSGRLRVGSVLCSCRMRTPERATTMCSAAIRRMHEGLHPRKLWLSRSQKRNRRPTVGVMFSVRCRSMAQNWEKHQGLPSGVCPYTTKFLSPLCHVATPRGSWRRLCRTVLKFARHQLPGALYNNAESFQKNSNDKRVSF